MADGPEGTTVNGREVSYVELGVKVHVDGGATLALNDLKGISWQTTNTVGKSGGPGGAFTRRTTGRNSYTCGCILYRSGKLQLIKDLGDIAEAAGYIGGDGEILWGRVVVTIQLTFSYVGEDAFQSVEIVKARFVDDSEKSSEGEAAQEAAMVIDALKIFDIIGGKRYAIN
jgi:hypothetical protein